MPYDNNNRTSLNIKCFHLSAKNWAENTSPRHKLLKIGAGGRTKPRFTIECPALYFNTKITKAILFIYITKSYLLK